MSTAQNQIRAVSLSFYALQIQQRQTHILSHQKLSISHSGRRLVCHFLPPHREQNQEVCERLRPRMQPESPFISVKTRGFLRSCSPSRLPPPPSPTRPPAPVAAYLRLLIRGCGETTNQGRKHESLGKESTPLLSCGPVCFTPQRAKKNSISFQTQ